MNIKRTERLLKEFSDKASEWFDDATNSFLKGNYEFYQNFFKKDNLEKIEWRDIQELGEHIHAFGSMPFPKNNALGKPNHKIEFYRSSFKYLAYGKDDLRIRVKNFFENEKLIIQLAPHRLL